MTSAIDFERVIRSRGAIKIGEFTAHNGMPGNCKIEIGEEFLKADLIFAGQIAVKLASQMEKSEPKLIVPIPAGANLLGEMVAGELGIRRVALDKKERDIYNFKSEADRILIEETDSIGFVDDVLRTGSSFREISALPEFQGSVVIGGVIWDRSDSAVPKNLDFPLEAVVTKYIPLQVDPQTFGAI